MSPPATSVAPDAPEAAPSETSKPPRSRAETVRRVLTALPFIPAILFLLYGAPAWGLTAFLAFGVVVCAIELGGMLAATSMRARALVVCGALGVFGSTVTGGGSLELVGLALTMVTIVALGLEPPTGGAGSGNGPAVLFAALYLGLPLGLLDRLHALDQGGDRVVLALTLAWFGDTAAYFAGRAFGRHKLAPSISPGKTVEGALGGLGGSLLAGGLGHALLGPALPLAHAVPLAIVAGVAGQLGDLFESGLKRATGTKDSGRFLPGHGGLLDRLDAVLATATVVYLHATYVAVVP